MQLKTILVIGGTGTISCGIAKEAINQSYEVTLLNRGHSSFRVPEGAKLIKGDIHNIEEFKKVLENNYDVIVDPLTFRLNDIKRMTGLIANHCKTYMFISSVAAFGLTGDVITEGSPKNPKWDYGIGKLECERYLENNKLPFNYIIIRPNVTYGDIRIPIPVACRKNPYTVLDRIKNDKPLVCFDLENESRRKLMDIRDFSKYVVKTINNDKSINNDYLVCSDESYTWKEAYSYLYEKLNKEQHLYYVDREVFKSFNKSLYDDIIYSKDANELCDKSKIKKDTELEYKEISLKEGISDLVDYLNTYYKDIELEEDYNLMVDALLMYEVKNKDEYLNDYINSLSDDYKKKVNKYWNTSIKNTKKGNSFSYKVCAKLKNIVKKLIRR